MAKNSSINWTQFFVVGIIAILLGGVIGAVAFSTEKEVPVEKTVYVNKTVEVPVNQTVEKIVEVNVPEDLLESSVDELLNYLDDEDMLTCKLHDYDDDEVSISKIYDTYSVAYDGEDYTIAGQVKLKFDEDDEKSCKKTYDFEVFYEDNEDPVVTIL